ncbi:hypothetical protein ACJQWK_10552 [Exserohilum turcicum]|uniref:Uncharacterized protein n=1 Tax=Exserohilum turcicum (strain 28A) TaxID=671987 RepID=R0KBP0_EXST2|nr:uncharacterized protein SETTUDRAFT_29087 [Exserohilum turcica Et28A]EOA85622.1 hypothetical protein SETTUDRAFT_29087 [Exserohilum turcica Et28A]
MLYSTIYLVIALFSALAVFAQDTTIGTTGTVMSPISTSLSPMTTSINGTNTAIIATNASMSATNASITASQGTGSVGTTTLPSETMLVGTRTVTEVHTPSSSKPTGKSVANAHDVPYAAILGIGGVVLHALL